MGLTLLRALCLFGALAAVITASPAGSCLAGHYWDGTIGSQGACAHCGWHRWCAGGNTAPVACAPMTGTTTPHASSANACVPVSCSPCGAPAALAQPHDLVYGTSGNADPLPNSVWIQFAEEGGISAPARFVCSFGGTLGRGVQLADVAMLHKGDVVALATNGAMRLIPGSTIAAMRAAGQLDASSRSCTGIAVALPAAASLPVVANQPWGGLTAGFRSNVLYASRNSGTVCSFAFTGSGTALQRTTSVCRTFCLTLTGGPTPRCGSNSGTDLVGGSDGALYLWAGADVARPFTGYRIALNASTGHLHASAPIMQTNQGLVDGSGAAQRDATFTNAFAACAASSVLGMALTAAGSVGAAWRFGDQYSGSVAPAVRTAHAARTALASRQPALKINGAASRGLCLDCGLCNTTGTAGCSDSGCVCKRGYAGPDCSADADGCAGDPCAGVANTTAGSCVDVPLPDAGFTCGCGAGFTWNALDSSCDDINGCAVGDPCAGIANTTGCVDVPAPGTGFTCSCASGFAWNASSSSCEDINGCAGDPCVGLANTTAGSCADVPAPGTGFTCACSTGFAWNASSLSCKDIDGCAGSPCAGIAHTTCADVPAPGTGFTCSCTSGFAWRAASSSCETVCDAPSASLLPANSNATWQPIGCAGVWVGSTCTAFCNQTLGAVGSGLTSTCLSNGTWSTPSGSGCVAGGRACPVGAWNADPWGVDNIPVAAQTDATKVIWGCDSNGNYDLLENVLWLYSFNFALNSSAPVRCYMMADNYGWIYINGVQVVVQPVCGASSWPTTLINTFTMPSGANTIDVYAKNCGGPAGLLIVVERISDGAILLQTNSAWLTRRLGNVSPP